jgi:hypothetical protein
LNGLPVDASIAGFMKAHTKETSGPLAGALFTALVAIAGCAAGANPPSGNNTPDAAPDTATGLPASPERMDIVAFLAAGDYKKAPWLAQTPAPREKEGSTSPHDKVRVWMNPPLVDSLRGGRDGLKDTATSQTHPPHDRWSMAVKELYDPTGATLQGLAAMYKTEAGDSSNSWVYYCHGPDGRCRTNGPSPIEAPVYGRGTAVACGFCHGGLVFTKAP